MSIEALNQVEIDELITCPKRVINPSSRPKTEGKHIRHDYQVASLDDRHEFVLFTRQSTMIAESFSAGLRWRSKTGEEVILMRCNGPDHPHGNSIERTQFERRRHVHRATERYLAAGRKVESFAEVTDAYHTLEGALHHLLQLTSISGLNTTPDETDLFPKS
jgi:hypothetical protein